VSWWMVGVDGSNIGYWSISRPLPGDGCRLSTTEASKVNNPVVHDWLASEPLHVVTATTVSGGA